ncbi:hypothetical protein SUGI_1002410 [Cryptomeria japonica]|nr:hypothetical protein SUGI_1002410 [Cryptomeria japonica]
MKGFVSEWHDYGGNSKYLFGDVRLHESHHLERQLRVNKDMAIAALAHIDDTHKMMDCCWKTQDGDYGLEGELSLAPLQVLKEDLVVIELNYIHLLLDGA